MYHKCKDKVLRWCKWIISCILFCINPKRERQTDKQKWTYRNRYYKIKEMTLDRCTSYVDWLTLRLALVRQTHRSFRSRSEVNVLGTKELTRAHRTRLSTRSSMDWKSQQPVKPDLYSLCGTLYRLVLYRFSWVVNNSNSTIHNIIWF